MLSQATQDNPVGLMNHCAVELLYATGMRVSELAGLDLSDIDHERQLLRVTGKGNKQRMLPYGRRAQDSIDRWIRLGRPAVEAPTSPESLLLSSRGRRVGVRQLYDVVASQLATTNLGSCRPSHSAALGRDSPFRPRGRPEGCAGDTWACFFGHNPDLHARFS